MALFVVIVGLIVAGCTPAPPETTLVRDAASAIGGADRIQAVRTLVIEARGTQYNLGQDVVPGASGQTFEITQYRRAIDVPAGRARTELTREPRFNYYLGNAAQRQVQGIDGRIGYNVAASGSASRIAEAAAGDRALEFLRHPLTAVRASLDTSSRLSNLRTEGAESLVDVALADGRTFTLAVDAQTKRPTRVFHLANSVNLGDIRVSTSFDDYEEAGGVQLPKRLTTKTDDFVTLDLTTVKQTIDADAGDLAAPPAAASAQPPAPQTPRVTDTEVAPGIWQLGGGSHRSVLVEFADRLVLFEAPQNDARTLAVIAHARALRPGKPLTHVVNTHHHFDHSGGIRAAVSEGLTVITHEGNGAFFQEIVKRPRTLSPDALSKHPRPIQLETVADEKTITDGSRTMILYHTPGVHSETMLTAYLPRERLLVQGDLYEPDEPVHVFAPGLLEQVKKRNLRIHRIVPLHSNVAPFDRLLKDGTAAAR